MTQTNNPQTYSATTRTPDGHVLGFTVYWSFGKINTIIDGVRFRGAVHFRGYMTATDEARNMANETFKSVLGTATPADLKERLREAKNGIPWMVKDVTLSKSKGKRVYGDGSRLKYYITFTDCQFNLSTVCHGKEALMRAGYSYIPTQAEIQTIMDAVTSILESMTLADALADIKQRILRGEWTCLKSKREKTPKPRREPRPQIENNPKGKRPPKPEPKPQPRPKEQHRQTEQPKPRQKYQSIPAKSLEREYARRTKVYVERIDPDDWEVLMMGEIEKITKHKL